MCQLSEKYDRDCVFAHSLSLSVIVPFCRHHQQVLYQLFQTADWCRNMSMRKTTKNDLLESMFDRWRIRKRLWLLVGSKFSYSHRQAANFWGCLLHMSLVGLQTWLYFFHVGDPLGLVLIASRRRPWPKCNRWNFLPLAQLQILLSRRKVGG